MDLAEIRDAVAEFDAIFDSAVNTPVDVSDPEWDTKLAAESGSLIDQFGVRNSIESLLSEIIRHYASGDEAGRLAIRELFARYTSFRWAAHPRA